MELESDDEREYRILCAHQIARLNAYNKHKEFIDNLHKGKQKKYRKQMQEVLKWYINAKTEEGLTTNYTLEDLLSKNVKPMFDNENEEINTICHYLILLNDRQCIETGFNIEEAGKILTFCIDYGVKDIIETAIYCNNVDDFFKFNISKQK